ncbi:MAG: flagellar motor switch protein FliN [Leifsonia flava]
MISTASVSSVAVTTLVEVLPTDRRLSAELLSDRSGLAASFSDAVVASFVGSSSAELALVLQSAAGIDDALGTAGTAVSQADALRPALEAAAATLGPGVLGTARVDRAGWVADAEAEVYALTDGGVTVGWFALRMHRPTRPVTDAASGDAPNLGRIRDVEMTLAVELGRTRMSVRDVLSIEPGSVIELDRSAGAPADVLLNGRLIAHGEIVVVDQDYAVRITRILDVAEGDA